MLLNLLQENNHAARYVVRKPEIRSQGPGKIRRDDTVHDRKTKSSFRHM